MTEKTDIAALRGEVPAISNLFEAGKFIAKVLDQLEAERQRADELEQSNDRIRQRWVDEVSNNCDAGKCINELEAELAALRGEQEPVAIVNKLMFSDVSLTAQGKNLNLPDGTQLFTRQPKPVVVLPAEFFTATQNMRGMFELSEECMCGITTGLEAAGIVVKGGE